jgi:glycosyltransferase involved in cell wall biosynthesis
MLARGLVRRGANVEVITTDPAGRLAPLEKREGVLVRRFPTLGRDDVYFVAPSLGRWLSGNAARFTLIHAHSYHTPLALQAALAGWWSGVPLVLTPHYHGTGHSPLRQALHLPYRLIGNWLVHRARRVICVSETERRLLHRHFGPNLASAVVPNGVEVEELRAARPRKKPSGRMLILAVGRLEPYKQIERLIAALPSLPAEYDVVLVGDGPARSRIERLAIRLRVDTRLRVLGQVPRPELLAWYRTADVFVSLSRQEAFGLTVLEAAVTGSAVVLSDIPAHREVAGYLPVGRVSFVSGDCSSAELARRLRAAAVCERATIVQNWPLPTWAGTVGGTLACYRAALGSDGEVRSCEVPA